ncbi:MAG: hypothetical protein IJC94_07640, partial [Oscillospiraceae bacterium]|nr:hypothetical protein [Oscillospiraceae bacterium]
MRFEVISYSSKAGMELNCDSVAWLDREDCVSAVICTAANDNAESVLKAKKLSGDTMERIYPCSSAEEAEEVCKAVNCSGVEGAVTLAVRDDCAVWQCFGSAAIYLFSEGKIQKTAGEEKQVCGKKML